MRSKLGQGDLRSVWCLHDRSRNLVCISQTSSRWMLDSCLVASLPCWTSPIITSSVHSLYRQIWFGDHKIPSLLQRMLLCWLYRARISIMHNWVGLWLIVNRLG